MLWKPNGSLIKLLENLLHIQSLVTMSKRRSMGTKSRDEVIITSSGINISNLSDAELVEYLQQKGADVGPVTGMFCRIELKAEYPTTRGIHLTISYC